MDTSRLLKGSSFIQMNAKPISKFPASSLWLPAGFFYKTDMLVVSTRGRVFPNIVHHKERVEQFRVFPHNTER